MNARIVHMDLDTFFVSVERILDPKLERQPVIVGGNPFGRGVVAGCSYEARAYGVHSAQPIRQAYRLCPQAAFLHGNYIHYAEYSRFVTDMLREIVPVCEKSSVDEFYLDLSQTERLKGDAYKWGQEIQRTITGETHLPISFGLATNKLVAKVATSQMAKKKQSERNHIVIPGHEAGFLAPFPIRAMPGIGEMTEEKLDAVEIKTIGQIAQTPIQVMERLFGKSGRHLHQKARGIDYSAVAITEEQKSYSRSETFSEDTLDAQKIFAELLKLSSRLAQDLRQAKLFASKLTLTLRYSDFETRTRARSCSYTNSDQDIYKIAKKLFAELWTRRVRVRLLGIEATGLLQDLEQCFLFSEERQAGGLYQAFDSLRHKYGNSIIRFAAMKQEKNQDDGLEIRNPFKGAMQMRGA